MKTIIEILALHGIDPQRGADFSVKVGRSGHLPLKIEHIGEGPNGLTAWSVSQSGMQNGDVMRDPELCLEVGADGDFYPYYFRNDHLGIEKFVYEQDEDGKITGVHVRLKRQLYGFSKYWDEQIRDAGFLEEAKQAKVVPA